MSQPQQISNVRDLGQKVLQRRKELGISQIELAGLAHCGHRFIRELEQGKESIRMGKALELCALLNIQFFMDSPSHQQEERSDSIQELF